MKGSALRSALSELSTGFVVAQSCAALHVLLNASLTDTRCGPVTASTTARATRSPRPTIASVRN